MLEKRAKFFIEMPETLQNLFYGEAPKHMVETWVVPKTEDYACEISFKLADYCKLLGPDFKEFAFYKLSCKC